MKFIKKLVALILCAALLTGLGVSAFAASAANPGTSSTKKDETVYTLLNSDGTVKSETVSCWLHAEGGLRGITDKSSLTNITNVKSDTQPQLSGSALTWNTDGTDLYYTGSSEKAPPVSVRISYKLDGKSISAEELIGKSGEVSMTFSFTNNEKQTALIAGKNRTVYTPFAIALVMDLPVKSFTEVKSGRGILTDSNNQILSYVCLPGLKENFSGLLPDDTMSSLTDTLACEFTVTAKTNAFAMPTVLIGAANSLADLQNIKLDGSLDTLTKSIGQLDGALSQLSSGTSQLSAALGEYDSKINTLSGGYTGLNSALLQAASGATALKNGSKQLDSALGLLSGQVTAQLIPGITASASKEQALTEKMTALQAQLGALNLPDISAIKTQLTAALSTVADASSNATIQILTGGKSLSDLTPGQQAAIASAKQQILTQAGGQVTQMLSGLDMSALESLKTSLTEIEGLSSDLMSSMNMLIRALYDPNDDPSDPKTLANAIIAASVGADSLYSGASSLSGGLSELTAGSETVGSGLKALAQASDTLAAKSGELSAGVTQLNSGIAQMTGSGILDNLDAIMAVKDQMLSQAAAYGSFSGAPSGASVSCRFVMKTADISSGSTAGTGSTGKAAVETTHVKTTFWQRIVDFFKNIF